MLLKIREKAQGIFAWVILILICVPFALWGIQNYLNVGQETPIATVGEKDFFQLDLNRAYAQYSQNVSQLGLDEETIKKQALDKLISDEVLLQYVQDKGLVVTDQAAREYIKSLQYFQVDGKFNKMRYESLLSTQNMTSAEFVGRIRNALIMEQFQQSIINSSFVTQHDVDNFFKIQNQQRSVEYVTVPLEKITEQPAEEEVNAYFQNHQDDYKTEEQVSIEYIELSLDELAKAIEPTEEDLQAFYDDQKDVYTTNERRKISHILFAFTEDTGKDEAALEKAKQARKRLETEDFAVVAQELSDDQLTAKNGGDLGLFNVGDMEPAFEEAAVSLQEGEISDPVKSAFGYHIIKVTELVPESIKPYSEVFEDVKTAYQKAEAENTFYELGETLTEVSYENSDNLSAVSEAVGIEIQKTDPFTRTQGPDIAMEQAVREASFSEEVLKGNNSDPIELGTDRLIVLRMLEYQPAKIKELKEVSELVVEAILADKARVAASEKAELILQQLRKGESLQAVAEKDKLELKKIEDLSRSNGELPWQLSQGIFKAAKPAENSSTDFKIAMPSGEQVVVSLLKVIDGKLTEEDKQKLNLAEANIARAFGRSDFNSFIRGLENDADITIRMEQQ